MEIMLSERGTRFDPIVLDAFFRRLADIEKIRLTYEDHAQKDQIIAHKSLYKSEPTDVAKEQPST